MKAPEIPKTTRLAFGFGCKTKNEWCFYYPSAEDVLVLCQAVAREGQVRNQVAQTLVNCFCLRRARVKADEKLTLADHVRQYAQPVNPRWFPEGDLFQQWNKKDPVKYALVHAERRRDVYSKADDFSEEVVAAVKRALTNGGVDILPNCTDYAASYIDASKKYRPLTRPQPGVNRLWTRSPTWGGYGVYV